MFLNAVKFDPNFSMRFVVNKANAGHDHFRTFKENSFFDRFKIFLGKSFTKRYMIDLANSILRFGQFF